MTQEHPISLPEELVDQWNEAWIAAKVKHEGLVTFIATQAACWGADQELEACCEWLGQNCGRWELPAALRAARRPKPPSLKERALQAWAAVEAGTDDQTAMAVIRRALEALPE